MWSFVDNRKFDPNFFNKKKQMQNTALSTCPRQILCRAGGDSGVVAGFTSVHHSCPDFSAQVNQEAVHSNRTSSDPSVSQTMIIQARVKRRSSSHVLALNPKIETVSTYQTQFQTWEKKMWPRAVAFMFSLQVTPTRYKPILEWSWTGNTAGVIISVRKAHQLPVNSFLGQSERQNTNVRILEHSP